MNTSGPILRPTRLLHLRFHGVDYPTVDSESRTLLSSKPGPEQSWRSESTLRGENQPGLGKRLELFGRCSLPHDPGTGPYRYQADFQTRVELSVAKQAGHLVEALGQLPEIFRPTHPSECDGGSLQFSDCCVYVNGGTTWVGMVGILHSWP